MSPHWLSAEGLAPCQTEVSGTQRPHIPKGFKKRAALVVRKVAYFICRGCTALQQGQEEPRDSVCPLGPDQELGMSTPAGLP